MFRFLGFMTGTALVIGAMVTVLGKPALQSGSPKVAADATVQPAEVAPTAESIAATAELLAEVSGPDGQVADFSIPDTTVAPMKQAPDNRMAKSATATDVVSDRQASGEPLAGLSIPAADLNEDLDEDNSYSAATTDTPFNTDVPAPGDAVGKMQSLVSATPLTSEAPAMTETELADSQAQWHAFWQPFRSQIAANGFAARLEAVTDMDYRVVRRMPGAYEVTFAYVDDSELTAKLAQIETATGLNLPEAGP